jgi:hypothetical protein
MHPVFPPSLLPKFGLAGVATKNYPNPCKSKQNTPHGYHALPNELERNRERLSNLFQIV